MDNTTQPKTPISGFKILTLNARGLKTKHKRLEIFDEIKQNIITRGQLSFPGDFPLLGNGIERSRDY